MADGLLADGPRHSWFLFAKDNSMDVDDFDASDFSSDEEEGQIDTNRVFILFLPILSKSLGKLTMLIILKQLAYKLLKWFILI